MLDGIGQIYTVKPTRTNGFRNIELAMHSSATMSAVKTYKFNGSRYLRSGCYELNFTVLDSKGNVQDLDEPRITPCRGVPRNVK